MTQKITIYDVAKYANVSVTTVSLALSGKGRISSATVAKINQAIEALGYIRNKKAAALRSGNPGVIGVIVKDISDPFYARIITGINEILTEKGYMLFLTQSGADNTLLLACVNSLIEQGVSGIILAEGGEIAHTIKAITDKQNIPLIIAAQSSNLSDISLVRSDNQLGAKLASEYLIAKGHRQIAYLGGKMSSLTRAERLAGFGCALSRHGLKLKPEWVLSNEDPELSDELDHFVKQYPNISAFLCHDTSTTLALFLTASRLGRNIGKGGVSSYLEPQVEIFSFGTQTDIYVAKNLISYVDNQPIEMGRSAAYHLMQATPNLINIIKPRLIT